MWFLNYWKLLTKFPIQIQSWYKFLGWRTSEDAAEEQVALEVLGSSSKSVSLSDGDSDDSSIEMTISWMHSSNDPASSQYLSSSFITWAMAFSQFAAVMVSNASSNNFWTSAILNVVLWTFTYIVFHLCPYQFYGITMVRGESYHFMTICFG